MTFGYFTFAQGDATYFRCAYALALSLSATQPKGLNRLSLGVVKKSDVPERYRHAFDQVVEVPWGDDAAGESWKLSNEWKVIHMSPYDETVKLDADMLFTESVASWLPSLRANDLTFATNVLTYRGELITSDACRQAFTESQLPNVYSAFTYFKKTPESFEFFDLCEVIFRRWQTYWLEALEPKHRPTNFSTDVAFALAAKQLGTLERRTHPWLNKYVPTFVHLKGELQGWTEGTESDRANWHKWLPVTYGRDQLFIGGFAQRHPVHYQHKRFVTDDMLRWLEERAA